MKIIGIVAEFNPFHNGHLHFINTVKKNYNPDVIIAVMSSSFTQRGEPSILNKWSRAKIAVENGVNLVFELPFLFSCQNAEIFSKGSIKILNSLDINALSFGIEDDIESILKISENLKNYDSKLFSKNLKLKLKSGNSFIKSRNEALIELGILDSDDILKISKPNNILAVEYLKAIDDTKKIELCPVKRFETLHDSLNSTKKFASGLKIRNLIKSNLPYKDFLPENSAGEISKNSFPQDELILKILKYKYNFSLNSIKNTLDYEIGIENRIYRKIWECNSLEDLKKEVSGKRITKSRVGRILMNSLLDVKKEDVINALKSDSYLRVLAFDEIGRDYLSNLNKNVITNFKNIKNMNQNIQEIAEIERNATDVYSILKGEDKFSDYKKPPIIKA